MNLASGKGYAPVRPENEKLFVLLRSCREIRCNNVHIGVIVLDLGNQLKGIVSAVIVIHYRHGKRIIRNKQFAGRPARRTAHAVNIHFFQSACNKLSVQR